MRTDRSFMVALVGLLAVGCSSTPNQVSAGLEGVCCGSSAVASGCAEGLGCQPVAAAGVGVCMPPSDAGAPDRCGAPSCSADGGTPVTCGGMGINGGPGVTVCGYHSNRCADGHFYDLDCDPTGCTCRIDNLITASFPVGDTCTENAVLSVAKCICHLP